VRIKAYRILGYTKEAFKDKDPDIRSDAYRALGYTKKALKDSFWGIREDAKLHFKIKEALENKENK